MAFVHALLVYSMFAALISLSLAAAAAVLVALRAGGRTETPADDYDALAVSRFTIPVSIIVPLEAAGPASSATLNALLGLNYPEFEVIAVGNNLADPSLEALKREWRFEPKEFFYRQSLATAGVRRIYRSARDARLILIDKAPAGLADALNCGVNVARFRYLTSVAPGIVCDANALLRAMAPGLRDPARVVAASSHVEVRDPEIRVTADAPEVTVGFERMASIRGFMESRIVWRRFACGIPPEDAIVVWRSDSILQVDGFSTTAADPELDMVFRLQMPIDGRTSWTIVRSAEVFGRVDPTSALAIRSRTPRRWLAAFRTVWAYRQLLGRGSFGTRALPYFIAAELVVPVLQWWTIGATAAGVAAGWLPWYDAPLVLVALSFGRAMVTNAALLVRAALPGAPDAVELKRLVLAAPFELVARAAAHLS